MKDETVKIEIIGGDPRADHLKPEISTVLESIIRQRTGAFVDVESVLLKQRSLDPVAAIAICVSFWMAQKLFVPYVTTRIMERAKMDAQRAARKRDAKAKKDELVEAFAMLRESGYSIRIVLYIPPDKFSNGMDANSFGGLGIQGASRRDIAKELGSFTDRLPALQHLIDTEITPEPVLGGVYLKFQEDSLEVSWIRQRDKSQHTRVIS